MDADFALLEAEDAASAVQRPLVVSRHQHPAQRLCSLPSCGAAAAAAGRSCCRCRPFHIFATFHAQVLMGWVGAQRDGALLKYAELLAAHGYSSVRSVQPTATAFSPLAGGRQRWALGMMAFLQQQALWPQRRLVFYAFSNGGLRWQGLAMPVCTAARLFAAGAL